MNIAAICKSKWHTIDNKQVECKTAVDNYQYKSQQAMHYGGGYGGYGGYGYDQYGGGPNFGSSYGQFGGGGKAQGGTGFFFVLFFWSLKVTDKAKHRIQDLNLKIRSKN